MMEYLIDCCFCKHWICTFLIILLGFDNMIAFAPLSLCLDILSHSISVHSYSLDCDMLVETSPVSDTSRINTAYY